MDLQAIKLQFIEEYLRIQDENIIHKLSKVLEEEKQKGNYITLSKNEEEAIVKGVEDVNMGNVYSHQEVMDLMRKKYPDIVK